MLNEIGYVIRKLRIQKGIGLNDFATKLEVSSGYLSNLETGKTETIHLSVLEKIQEELNIFPMENFGEMKTDSEFDYRVNRVNTLLAQLHNKNRKQAEYFLNIIEQGMELLNDKEK
ncbi:helix-turn-helix domain-containing protein [Peribacillus frigoritolerans]|uniref:helix-turn-helix domain-containing protein n=1 Tax=Peribacillus frigoritolerans TaxID=450367 RepID=UPI003B8C80AA